MKDCLKTTLVACLTGAISLSVASTAQKPSAVKPAQSWYQIEILVYSQLPLGQQQNEVWPSIAAFSLPKTPTISLVPPNIFAMQQQTQAGLAAPINTYPLVDSNDFKLQDEAAHLMRGENYQIMSQTAWLQPIDDTKQATPVYIQAANDQSSMDALITINKQHFFLFHINAIFSTPLTAFANPNDNLKSIANQDGQVRFQLIRSLRMRANEINYIDFPYYGVIVDIFPHAAP